MKPLRTLSERLSKQKALLGLLQSNPNPALAEMAGMCGYDFLLMDGEHGVFSESDYLHGLRAAAAVDMLAFVRLAKHDLQALGRYLDVGFDAIVVPNVSTAEQARGLSRAMTYPPTGTRGFGAALHRSTRYGMDLAAHINAPRERVSLLVIIESALGAANVEDILAVEGVDGAIVGPADLTADLGFPGDFSMTAYTRALEGIERAVLARGKLLGTAPHPGRSVEVLRSLGYRLILLGADVGLVRDAMLAQVSMARSCL